MPSTNYNDFTHTVARGDDRILALAFTDPDTAIAENITGWAIWMTAKAAVDNDATDAAALFQYEIGSGITVTNAVGGLAEVDLSGLDSDALAADTTVFVDIQCKNGAGRVWTAATGKITFYREITRSRV